MPGALRDIPNSFRDIPNSFRDVNRPFRDIPPSVRNVPHPVRDVPEPLWSVPKRLPDMPNADFLRKIAKWGFLRGSNDPDWHAGPPTIGPRRAGSTWKQEL